MNRFFIALELVLIIKERFLPLNRPNKILEFQQKKKNPMDFGAGKKWVKEKIKRFNIRNYIYIFHISNKKNKNYFENVFSAFFEAYVIALSTPAVGIFFIDCEMLFSQLIAPMADLIRVP